MIEINKLTKQQTIKAIVNQANSINKKLKQFDDLGIEEYREFVENLVGESNFNKQGSITKAIKSHYKNINILHLKKTLNALIKINNNETYGTVNKYYKAIEESKRNAIDTMATYLINKGYDEYEVRLMVESDTFLSSVYSAWKDLNGGYGSLQLVEKVFLEYTSTMNKKQVKKAMSNVEFSLREAKKLDDRIREEKEFEEWKRGKNRR